MDSVVVAARNGGLPKRYAQAKLHFEKAFCGTHNEHDLHILPTRYPHDLSG